MTYRTRSVLTWAALVAAGLAAGVAVTIVGVRMPQVRGLLAGLSAAEAAEEAGHDHEGEPAGADHDHEAATACGAHCEHAGEDPDEHDHDHAAEPLTDHVHDEANALSLSRQAEANIGLKLAKVRLEPFERTVTVPATVVERPGRSQVRITAPLTGLVTRIRRIEGEAVAPGAALFDLQLTHEELVQAQADFLQTAEQLEVVGHEVQRISKVVHEGAVAGKALLERQYEQQKLEAALHALRQRLILHRLTPEQVDAILTTRTLLRDLTVKVPGGQTSAKGAPAGSSADASEPAAGPPAPRLLVVQKLEVQPGQHVEAGTPLCTLADHAELYVEGKAFEEDIPALDRVVAEGRHVTAVFQAEGSAATKVEDLQVLYLSDKVDIQSRAFTFYVTLPNRLLRDTGDDAGGPRFVNWQFKPGQRVRLMVPVERWPERIVVPVGAVVQDGAEAYVFEHNQDHFDRRTVHVEYRDQDWAVIANDGTLKPGAQVAASGAYQIYLATKNKNGTPIDPHAGHNH